MHYGVTRRVTVSINLTRMVKTEDGLGWTRKTVGTRTADVEVVIADHVILGLAKNALGNKTRKATEGGMVATVFKSTVVERFD